MKTYNISRIPDGFSQPTYDELLLSGYTQGYEDGYNDGIEACKDYSREYLTIKSLEEGVIKVSIDRFDYSINEGPWQEVRGGTGATLILVDKGDEVRFRGEFHRGQVFSGNTIQSVVYGNILSIIYGDSFVGKRGPGDFSGAFSWEFFGYTGLVDASKLIMPVEVSERCCLAMFSGCTSLTIAPELPATTLADACYNHMFNGCTSLTTAPELPAPTLVQSCYGFMFSGCTKINYVKCLATDISAEYCVQNWLRDAPASGTFVKAASMNDWTTGIDGIPSGWTIQDA